MPDYAIVPRIPICTGTICIFHFDHQLNALMVNGLYRLAYMTSDDNARVVQQSNRSMNFYGYWQRIVSYKLVEP
jgi:hypothetical protein